MHRVEIVWTKNRQVSMSSQAQPCKRLNPKIMCSRVLGWYSSLQLWIMKCSTLAMNQDYGGHQSLELGQHLCLLVIHEIVLLQLISKKVLYFSWSVSSAVCEQFWERKHHQTMPYQWKFGGWKMENDSRWEKSSSFQVYLT